MLGIPLYIYIIIWMETWSKWQEPLLFLMSLMSGRMAESRYGQT